jgi:hypothetical protein
MQIELSSWNWPAAWVIANMNQPAYNAQLKAAHATTDASRTYYTHILHDRCLAAIRPGNAWRATIENELLVELQPLRLQRRFDRGGGRRAQI